ncbi:D-2-hydroxyacid dehydrogenase [Symbiobacterium thermophilum]|uniref:D-2-hydroxyacid dehydrogenase n=1 Tax=Symbiobacterium thermophilum TaxID=2734 RepID=UPI0002E97651|nr:D-2-hydroxyacid dehydrogenase [Symbiobacterium thermophilum]
MARVILVYEPKRAGTYADLLERAIPNPADYRLIPCTSREEAERAIGEAEILFCFRFPADLLQGAHRLRWIQAMAAGVDDLVAAPLPPGVLLTRIEGLFGTPMSEYAFAHMLAYAQQLRRVYAAQAERRWDPFRAETLAGKRLGVAGIGSIGLEVAVRGKAFGMEVWGLARTPGPRPHVDRVFTPDQVREFTAGVDFLVSTLPDTPETRGLIDPEGMKEGALLINVGRGATLDEGALLRAVRSGRIRAVLDVFAVEPLPGDHLFWTEPGITVTPHMSGLNRPDAIAAYCAENLRRFERGEPLRGVVDLARGY